MTSSPSDSESEQRYEELRREILEAGPGRGPGLSIFLQRGMASWLQELARWTETAPSRWQQGEPSGAPVPSSTKGEVVYALAGMILGLECARRA